MRLVTFAAKSGQARFGALIGQHVVELVGEGIPGNILDFLREGDRAKQAARRAIDSAENDLSSLVSASRAYPVGEIAFLPPIQRPGKIICIGLNYRAHVAETGREMPKFPTLFAKFSNTLIGHRQPIVMPRISANVDWEGEGVGHAREPRVFLKPGDVVQIEISGLGVLENPVVAAPS